MLGTCAHFCWGLWLNSRYTRTFWYLTLLLNSTPFQSQFIALGTLQPIVKHLNLNEGQITYMKQLLERIDSCCHILEALQSWMNTRQRIALTAALQIFHLFPNMFSFAAPFDLPNHMTKWWETSSSQADFCSSPLVFLRRSPQGGQDGRACSWSRSYHSASEKWGRVGVILGHLTNLCLIWKAFCCTNQESTVTLCATMTLASFHHHFLFSKQIHSGLRTSTPIKISTKQENNYSIYIYIR